MRSGLRLLGHSVMNVRNVVIFSVLQVNNLGVSVSIERWNDGNSWEVLLLDHQVCEMSLCLISILTGAQRSGCLSCQMHYLMCQSWASYFTWENALNDKFFLRSEKWGGIYPKCSWVTQWIVTSFDEKEKTGINKLGGKSRNQWCCRLKLVALVQAFLDERCLLNLLLSPRSL